MAEAGRGARERGAAAARDRDVLGACTASGMPAPVEPVVEAGDRLAQLPEAGDRRVLLIAGVDRRPRGCAAGAPGSAPGLGLPLAEVAPVGIARRGSRASCASVVT